MLPEIEIWLNNQFSSVLAKWMKAEWLLEVKSSFALKTEVWKDRDIFLLAKRRGNIILLTKDADFSKLIDELGAPPKIIKLNTGNLPSKILWEKYKTAIKSAIEVLSNTDVEIIYIE